MIGIVVVSHSTDLAAAAVALAREMVEGTDAPPMAIAAGLDDGSTGTDAAAVAAAIESLTEAGGAGAPADGVLVLVDLGSAVLSAEMALEFLDPQLRDRVRVSAAPLVEGLVPAVVTAATGADLSAVAAEAEAGLQAKATHLSLDQDAGAGVGDDPAREAAHGDTGGSGPALQDEIQADLRVTNPHGLHARPAARLVAAVNAFGADRASATISNLDTGRGPVDTRSLTAVATLDARQGHTVRVRVSGVEAEALLESLRDLAASGFGDHADRSAVETRAGRDPAPQLGRGSGLQAAVGPVRWADRGMEDPLLQHALRAESAQRSDGDDGAASAESDSGQRARLQAALERVGASIRATADHTAASLGQQHAEVFSAHLALLSDPELLAAVDEGLAHGSSAAQVWAAVIRDQAERFASLSDPYQRERAADVRSVGLQVLRDLLGLHTSPEPSEGEAGADDAPRVLVVEELSPALAVALDPASTVAVVAASGGATGHGVLLARSRGFPILTGAQQLRGVADGTRVALDERSGLLWIDPDADRLADFDRLLASREAERSQAEAAARDDAVTGDGVRVRVKANVGVAEDAGFAAAGGADGSGLVRTELLFATWRTAPTVSDQEQMFGRIVDLFAPGPVTFRTWDTGADKPLPFLPMEPEQNPFLGVRGLRAFRADPEPLLDQLEAVCRVAATRAGQPVRVMFPMVATAEELDWAIDQLRTAAGRAGAVPKDADWPVGLDVGMMVEIPAAVHRVEALSANLDFVSIGSNDLTQYLLAADRGNAALGDLSDHADPAVLAAIGATCDGVADGVTVGLCGDAAADLDLVPVLLGLGVTELSVSPGAVALVKAAVRATAMRSAVDLAARVVRMSSAAQVREAIRPPLAGGTER